MVNNKVFAVAVDKILNLTRDRHYKIDDKLLKKFYLALIDKGLWNEIESLEKITGKKLVLDERMLQLAYKKLISDGRIYFVEHLYKKSGVKPQIDEKKISTCYKKLIRAGNTKDAKILQEISGIRINIDEKTTQAAVKKILKRKDLFGVAFLSDMIRPSYILPICLKLIERGEIRKGLELCSAAGLSLSLDKNKLQELYKNLLRKGKYQDAGDLERSTGVKPDHSLLQEATNLIVKKNIYAAREFYELFNVKPNLNHQEILDLENKLLKKCDIGQLEVLKILLQQRLQTNPEQLNMTCKKLLAAGDINGIKKMQELYNFQINDPAYRFLLALNDSKIDTALTIYQSNQKEVEKKVPKAKILSEVLEKIKS